MNNIAIFLRESKTARFLIPMGILFIIFGIIMFVINNKHKDYIETEAVVSSAELAQEAYTDVDGNYVEATYRVFVKYSVDGQEYNQELGELSGYKKGDKITIAYDPKDPSHISQPIGVVIPTIICVAGVAALVGGIVSAAKAINRHKELKKQEEGWSNE